MPDRGDKYITVFESLMVPVLLLDAEGRVDNFNEAAALLFGIGAVSDADGAPMASGEAFAPLRDDIQEFNSGKAVEHGFERAVSTAVGLKYFQVRLKRIRDVGGGFLGTAVVLFDITDRKAIEDEIRDGRAQYSALFENMDDAFVRHEVVIDETGDAVDYVFLEVNPAFERAFGLASPDVVGRRASEVWAEQPFDSLASYSAAVRGKSVMCSERYVAYIDKWFLVRSFLLGGDGRFATLFTDITAAKLFEAQLERMVSERAVSLQRSLDELEVATRVKDDFLASMSHELRTPLHSILGFSGMLLGGLAGPLNEEQCRQVSIIRESGERLLTLVNDLLDLTSLEKGQAEVSVEEFDLVALVQAMADMVGPMADAKALVVEVNAAAPLIPVWTDRDKVGQIVLNLLSNAIKYTEAGAVVVLVDGTRDGMSARIVVTDTGRGMAPEVLEAVFDFRNVRGVVRDPMDGAGLGLSISKRLAALLGGTLAADSTPGKGSAFTLRIPVRHPNARL